MGFRPIRARSLTYCNKWSRLYRCNRSASVWSSWLFQGCKSTCSPYIDPYVPCQRGRFGQFIRSDNSFVCYWSVQLWLLVFWLRVSHGVLEWGERLHDIRQTRAIRRLFFKLWRWRFMDHICLPLCCRLVTPSLKVNSLYMLSTAFMSWTVPSNHQWMAVGVCGRHGDHAAWRVERDTGHVLAHVQIQRQNGTERTALRQISPQEAAIYTNVKVDRYLYLYKIFP